MPALSNDDKTQGTESRRPAAGSRPYWLGIGVMAIGAVWFYGGGTLPQGARYAAVGPGLFVTVAGVGLLVLGAILTLQIARGETFQPQDAEEANAEAPMDKTAFFTALLAAAIPIIIMKPLGLPLTATISFMSVARAFGSRRWALDLFIGAILASISWVLFTRLGLQLGHFFPPLGF